MTSDDQTELKDALTRAAERDPDAWEWLYRRSHQRLFSFARRRVADDASAEDAVSETMTRALESIDDFRWKGAGFDAWLYGILRNVVLEQYRAAERTGHDPGEDAGATLPEHDPSMVAERADERRTMVAAFDRLSDEDREVLELRVIGELSSDEAAEVLGKKPGTVRMAQARALERLREHLEEDRDAA